MYQHFFGVRVFLFAFDYNQPLNFGKWVIPLNDIPLEDSVRLTLIIYVLVTLVLFFFFFLNQLYNRF